MALEQKEVTDTGSDEFTSSQGTRKSTGEKTREASKTGDPIDLRAKVTVFSTAKDEHHYTGESFSVHPKQAQALIRDGFATEKEADALATKKSDTKDKKEEPQL